MGNQQGDIILANELVVARLAMLIEAPCPRGELVFVDQTMIEEARREIPSLGNSRPGPALGSAWVEPQYAPGEQICATARNRRAISGLIALYTLVNNHNLADSHLLWTSFPGGSHEVYGFDHGRCFGNPQWDGGILAAIPQIQMRTLPQLTSVASRQAIDGFIERIGSLNKNQLDSAVSNIPSEWNVSPVAEFITGKAEVREGGRGVSLLSVALGEITKYTDSRARFSPPRAVEVDRPEETLRQLFREFVGPLKLAREVTIDKPAIRTSLRRTLIIPQLQRSKAP